MCSDWISGTPDTSARHELFESITSDNTLKFVPGSAKEKDWLSVKSDSQGNKATCRDYFPTVGERYKFERLSDDPFDIQYRVTRQYCWVMDIFDSKLRCGMCRIHWKWGFIPIGCKKDGWDPPQYTTWGETHSADFSPSDVADSEEGGVPGKTRWVAALNTCLIQYPPGTKYNHEGKNTSNRTRVCAYGMSPFAKSCQDSPLISWNYGLLGCVNVPIPGGPPVYNPVLVNEAVPLVDNYTKLNTAMDSVTGAMLPGYISLGSTFRHPIIRLISYIDQKGHMHDVTTLQYKFPGDSGTTTYPQCSTANGFSSNQKYCAKVVPGAPHEVCVCEESRCSDDIYMGCVPRPTPKQSGLKLVAEYINVEHKANQFYPAANLYFVHTDTNGRPKMWDDDNDRIYVSDDGIMLKYDKHYNKTDNPAKKPIRYDRLPLPLEPLKLMDYHKEPSRIEGQTVLSKINKDVYGVSFKAAIPQFDSTGEYKRIIVGKPELRRLYGEGEGVNCCAYFASQTDDDMDNIKRYPKAIVPAGHRDTDACNLSINPGDDYHGNRACNKINSVDATCRHDEEAIKADCPGVYMGPNDISRLDKICIIQDNKNKSDEGNDIWNIDKQDNFLCAAIPIQCFEINEPTRETAFATWPAMELNATQEGECDIKYGLTKKFEVIATKKNIDGAIKNIKDNVKDKNKAAKQIKELRQKLEDQYPQALQKISELQQEADDELRNISRFDIDNLKDAYPFIKFSINEFTPERECKMTKSYMLGNFKNGCVLAEGCVDIDKTGQVTGYAKWSEPDDSYLSAQVSRQFENPTGILKLKCHGSICTTNITFTGDICNSAQRDCIVTFDESNMDILHSVWDKQIHYPCSK